MIPRTDWNASILAGSAFAFISVCTSPTYSGGNLRADCIAQAKCRTLLLTVHDVSFSVADILHSGRYPTLSKFRSIQLGDRIMYDADTTGGTTAEAANELWIGTQRTWVVDDGFGWWNRLPGVHADLWPTVTAAPGLSNKLPVTGANLYHLYLPPVRDQLFPFDLVALLEDPDTTFTALEGSSAVVRIVAPVVGAPADVVWSVDLDLEQMALPVAIRWPGLDTELRVLETVQAGPLVMPSLARLAPSEVWAAWDAGEEPTLDALTTIVDVTLDDSADGNPAIIVSGELPVPPLATLDEVVASLPAGTPVGDMTIGRFYLAGAGSASALGESAWARASEKMTGWTPAEARGAVPTRWILGLGCVAAAGFGYFATTRRRRAVSPHRIERD